MKPDESRTVYDGKLIDVTLERWGDHEREIVEHPGVGRDRRRRPRGAASGSFGSCASPRARSLVELPAGTRERGEEPLDAAQRELREECGLTGGDWSRARCVLDDARLLPRAHAPSSSPRTSSRARRIPDDDEEVEVVGWPVAELDALSASSRTRRRSPGSCSSGTTGRGS